MSSSDTTDLDANGWELVAHPIGNGLRSLAHDDGGALICYDDSPLTPDQMRNLAAVLDRSADEVENGA